MKPGHGTPGEWVEGARRCHRSHAAPGQTRLGGRHGPDAEPRSRKGHPDAAPVRAASGRLWSTRLGDRAMAR